MKNKPTAERILDAAEEMFASVGFDATSLGDVADVVGIRGPGIYKHFKNKQALYEAVVARLLDPIAEMLAAEEDGMDERVLFSEELISELFRYHVHHANVSRLVQHATLAGGEQLNLITDRWCKPMLLNGPRLLRGHPYAAPGFEKQMTSLLIVFTNMVLAYVTLGPLYERIFDIDTLSEEQMKLHVEIISKMAKGLFEK